MSQPTTPATPSTPAAPAIRVGLLGAGNMGAPMGHNILRADVDLTLWHRRPEATTALAGAGARVVATPAELARASDVLLVVLPDLPDLRGLLGGDTGLLAGIDHPIVIVVSSTVSAVALRELAGELAELTGGLASLVDAPVSGGQAGAEAGTLAIFVGGDAQDVARVTPVLAATGRPVHLGGLGAGQVAKACNQIVVAATTFALGEAAVLAERSGVDVAALLDLLQGGMAGSRILELSRDRFVTHDHASTGPARYMLKDLRYALEQARAAGTAVPLSTELLTRYADLTERGHGDENLTVVQEYVAGLDA